MDLVAATANGDSTCVWRTGLGYALNVSDEVLALSPTASLPAWATSPTCVMASLPEPPLALDFAASRSARPSPPIYLQISPPLSARGANPPFSCPSKSAAQRLTAAAAGWCFMAAAIWGAFSFFLV